MKTPSKNFTKKSAPVIPQAQPETKRVKVSAALAETASAAVKRFQSARAEYNAATEKAQQSHAKMMEIAQMHDGLFRALVIDGGATVEDFKHGFELKDGYLIAKPPAPAEQPEPQQ